MEAVRAARLEALGSAFPESDLWAGVQEAEWNSKTQRPGRSQRQLRES